MIASRRSPLAWAAAALIALGCEGPPAAIGTDAARTDASPVDAAGAADAAAGMPDLFINEHRITLDFAIREHTFAPDACELDPDESCIGGPGLRRLLHFSIESPNIGDADLFLGQPDESNPNFSFSQCHQHFHYEGYATYEIIDNASQVVATGRKQAFCLVDTKRYLDEPSVSPVPQYSCFFQGISAGWSDVYESSLPCQFIDITDLPAAEYTLKVELNKDRTLPESSYDNNIVSVPLDLSDPGLSTPTEPCPLVFDKRSAASLARECGWTRVGEFACIPGGGVRVGCHDECGALSLGSCTGDPMIRVCDPDRPDGNCSRAGSIRSSNNACQNNCPLVADALCPDSGRVEVFTAAVDPSAPYTCDVEVELF